MRTLITGGYGFVGRHLAQHLVKCGDDVAVTYFRKKGAGNVTADPEQDRNTVPFPPSVQSLTLDITDRGGVDKVMTLLQPDAVYHLAGITFVPQAEGDVYSSYEANTVGTVNLLESINKHSRDTRFLFVSSSEVYGEPRPGTLPITEQAELRPMSAYGITKAAADVATYKYSAREGLHTIRVRPFPHIGPGQSEHFSIAGFAKQLAEIKLGLSKPQIKVGNLEAKRDISDVSDIVRGYREALLNGKKGEAYNLCSGQSISIADVLNKLIAVAEVEAEVEVDPARVRPVDIADVFGSYQKAQRDFGWKPRIDLEGTLHSLFAYWIEFLSNEKNRKKA